MNQKSDEFGRANGPAQTNLGPALNPGGELDVREQAVLPSRDRQHQAKTGQAEHSRKAMSGTAGTPGPGRVISEEERAGVPATDTTAASPHGVGVSVTPRGEERAVGRAGPQSRRADENSEQRRKDREQAGAAPGQPIAEGMPNLRPGDQAG